MARRRRRRKKTGATALRMTSMMDILTVLLLFLLKSFVVEGEVVTPAAGLELPESTSQSKPEASVVVAIAEGRITVGDEVVARVDDEREGELYIAPLAQRLVQAREQMEDLARRRGGGEDAHRHVTIQGDREMPFNVLQRVMYTCNQSGYEDISLAVIQG